MRWLYISLACMLVLPLSACGNKGKLKTPAEIEREQVKKEREAEKKRKPAANAATPIAPPLQLDEQ